MMDKLAVGYEWKDGELIPKHDWYILSPNPAPDGSLKATAGLEVFFFPIETCSGYEQVDDCNFATWILSKQNDSRPLHSISDAGTTLHHEPASGRLLLRFFRIHPKWKACHHAGGTI